MIQRGWQHWSTNSAVEVNQLTNNERSLFVVLSSTFNWWVGNVWIQKTKKKDWQLIGDTSAQDNHQAALSWSMCLNVT